MNEEEKKAIEYLERHLLPYCREGNIKFMLNDVILNLIKKQQKEIEELRQRINRLIVMKYIENDYYTEVRKENSVSKYKIRKKIEEITSYAYTSAEERDCQDYAIQVLKELLGE